MRILVLNSGSSSLKFRLVDIPPSSSESKTNPITRLQGTITGIGEKASLKIGNPKVPFSSSTMQDIRNHEQAVEWIWERLQSLMADERERPPGERECPIDAVGIRVVHGGHRFTQSVLIDENVLSQIDELSHLAHLDSRANDQLHDLSSGAVAPIHAKDSGLNIVVAGTDEATWMAHETYRFLGTPHEWQKLPLPDANSNDANEKKFVNSP